MKIKKIALLVAAVGMTFSVASVSAGELANEFGGQVALGSTKAPGAASTSFGYGGVYYGRFLTPSFEAIGGLDYSVATGVTSTGVNIGGAYYFTPVGHAGSAAFYVGADVGSRSTTNAASQSAWDVNGGMKYFVTDSAAIDVKLKHQEWKPTNASATKMDLLVVGASVLF